MTKTPIGIMVEMIANGPGYRGSIPGWDIPKIEKWYIMVPCLTLSIIRGGSKVSGAIQGKELYPLLHFDVVV